MEQKEIKKFLLQRDTVAIDHSKRNSSFFIPTSYKILKEEDMPMV